MQPIYFKRRSERLRKGILASTLLALGAGEAGSLALAQEEVEEIQVTGSRIVRRDFEANSPIVTVDEELFDETASVGVENVMNQLPQFVPAATQFDSTEVQSTATTTPGASTLSLRGLGSNRNLVLLDGRRAMPVNASGAVDINMIPSAAIQRVETITGGASSTYGADAMAGVVNFILKRDYEGVEFDAQYGITEEGDGQTEQFSGIYGANFMNGQGNALLGFGYSRRGSIAASDRSFYRRGWADPTVAGSERRLDLTNYNAGGNPPSQGAVNQVFSNAPGAVNPGGTYYLNEDGTVFKASPDGSYRYNGVFETERGVFRKYTDEGELTQNQMNELVSIPMERYSLFGRAHIDLTDNVSTFMQGNFSQNRNNTVLTYSPAMDSWGVEIPYGSDPYAPSVDENGNTLPAYQAGGQYGLDCGPVGGCTESEAFPVPPELQTLLDSRDDPNASWDAGHVLDWAGPRRSSNTVTSYQLVFGFDGRLPIQDWTWETYVSQGTTQVATTLSGIASLARFREVASSPNFGQGFFYTGNPQGGGFGGGLGQCTTGLPIVASFNPSDDCLHAVTGDMQNTSTMEQKVAEANLQGRAMELPAGELRFAAGLSYRENTFDYVTDILTSQRSFLDSAVGLFPASNSAGDTSTREAYVEALVPVLRDLPAMRELNFELGYRYSDNDPSPSVETYKVLFDWAVNDRIRFRGGRQIANRAPNVSELYLARTQTLEASFMGDFCSENNPVNPLSANPELNPNAAQTRALCAELMGEAGAMEYYESGFQQPDGSFVFTFANLVGNPDLDNERAETYTLGGVFNIAERSTLTLDWYDIEITDLISAQTTSSVYAQCMDPSLNPDYDPTFGPCTQLVRNPVTGVEGPTDVAYSNEGAVRTSGVDVQYNWSTDIFNGGLNVSVMLNYLLDMDTRVNDEAEWTDWVGTAGPNDVTGVNTGAFEYRTFTTLTYFDNAGWNATLRWRHLPELEPASAATGETTILSTNEYNIFDFSGGYRFGRNENWLLRVGIDNLFNTDPEIVGRDPAAPTTAAGSTMAGFYDVIGRNYYVGVKAEF